MTITYQFPLPFAEWQRRSTSHRERAREWTEPFRRRRLRRVTHPVYDFLFVYYRLSPAKLEQWHPGIGIALELSESDLVDLGKHYKHDNGLLSLNKATLDHKTRARFEFILRLGRTIEKRPPQFGCSGLHEWAMVYRGNDDGEVRHAERLPLRLSQEAIDEVVNRRPVSCSHYDAFRFFTPSARSINRIQPKKQSRLEFEQCGCLHTNMDLYRWAADCMPWVGSDLLWDCFQLAAKARVLDMRASPYDCSEFGYLPIKIETSEGRVEYERRQREISAAAHPLRSRLIEQLEALLETEER